MKVTIRTEQPQDIEAIAQITKAAFQNQAYSSHTEHFIVNALRKQGQLTVSLVAVIDEVIIGHVAVSPVDITSGAQGWYGLGPISVRPDCQGKGIGSQLIKTALVQLQNQKAKGCVLLGDPAYYSRFGFKVPDGLELPGVPKAYFQALSFDAGYPQGQVRYHEAFNAVQ